MPKLRKTVAMLLLIALLSTSFSLPTLAGDGSIISSWATKEVELAESEGLSLPFSLDWSRSIQRDHATTLVVNFVEKVTGQEITDYKTGVFSDSESYVAEKAYSIGVIKGIGDDPKFVSSGKLSREQYVNMLYRAVTYIGKVEAATILPKISGEPSHSDWDKVSKWAKGGVSSMVYIDVFRGTSATTLDPTTAISIEQAVVLLYRSSCLVSEALKKI